MADILGMLAITGPLPIEDAIWKSGNKPADSLQQIVMMERNGLVAVRGTSIDRLRDLHAEVAALEPQQGDAALDRIHQAFANEDASIELTKIGLQATRAPA